MEILVGVGLHALVPSSIKRIRRFLNKRKCARKIFIAFVTLSNVNRTSSSAVPLTHTSYKIHDN